MKGTWYAIDACEDTKSNVRRKSLSIKEQRRAMFPPLSPQLTANKEMETLVQLMQGTAFCQQQLSVEEDSSPDDLQSTSSSNPLHLS